ncbi:MAG: AAA family ATPase [Bacteroidota bacterium]
MPIPAKNEAVSFQALFDDPTQEPECIIGQGILPARSLLMISGQHKQGKTMFAQNLAIALASGRSFVGFTIPAVRKVLFLSAEGGYFSARSRIRTMLGGLSEAERGRVLQNAWLVPDTRVTLDSGDAGKVVRQLIEEHKPEVVFVDPFIKFHGAKENETSEMAKVLGVLRNIIEDSGVSIVLIHHIGKKVDSESRGSSTIEAEYDSRIKLCRPTKTEVAKVRSIGGGCKVIKLDFCLRHAETPDPIHVCLDSTVLWFGKAGVDRASELLAGKDDMSRPQRVKMLTEAGVPRSTAQRKVTAFDKSRGV